MYREGEIRIKIYSKITGKRTGSEIISKEGDRGSGEFATLLRGPEQKIFCFSRVDGESVKGKPSVKQKQEQMIVR